MKDLFYELLERYHQGKSTKKELEQMTELLKEDPSLYQYLDQHVNREWELESIQSGLEKTESGRKNHDHVRRRKWMLAVAAGLIIMIVAGAVFFWWNSAAPYSEYYTDYGERKKIELPDGSHVELNANTRLKWKNNWAKTGVREVMLDGEAFFEVVKSEAGRFRVFSDNVSVNVLGTSFNVSNRRGKTEVYLEKGKVALELPGRDETIDMKPGEKIRYDGQLEESVYKMINETLHSAAAWKTGVISYQKVPLKRILPELSDIYGVKISCDDPALLEKVMDIGVPYMDWEATKSSLELAMKVHIEKENGGYILKEKDK